MEPQRSSNATRRATRWAATILVLTLAAGGAAQDEPKSTTQPSVAERQERVRQQVQHLENRLLTLGRLLAESEPEKAERLKVALDRYGQHQVKRRLERVVQLLQSGRLSDAEHEQETLLADLESMLTALTDTASDLDRRRAERERLEGFRRIIRALQEGQLEQLYRAKSAAAEADHADQQTLEELERAQRNLERQAADLAEKMKSPPGTPSKTPGERQVAAARQQMQDAADRLAQQQASEAEGPQQVALEQLQRAQDELDDALRQVRREELEETLAALETRFKSMLTRERAVRADVGVLHAKDSAQWNRADELKLAELAQTQRHIAEDCSAVVRILVGEGTTVILPDLAEQLAAEMTDVAGRLDHADVSPAVQGLLDDIIAQLEEIVGAIEVRRGEERNAATQPAESGSEDGSRPLLPGSAELKLLRAAQVRVNEKTAELGGTRESLPATQRDEALRKLADRQRRIAEMARRMNERP